MKKITCVVYANTNTVNGKKYVGSTKRPRHRWVCHRTELNKGIHPNRKLQAAWNKYRPGSFVFEVRESFENQEELLTREQRWIDELRTHAEGYNLAPRAGNCLGVRHSEETRKRMALSQSTEQRSRQTKAGFANMTTQSEAEWRAKVQAALTPEVRLAAAAKRLADMTCEARSELARKAAATRKASGVWESETTKAKRRESLKRVAAERTGEERKEIAKRAADKFQKEARSKAGKDCQLRKTPEQRSESARKTWEARRANGTASIKGRVVSQEARTLISKALMGHKPTFSKPVILLNTGQVFESAMLAERLLGVAAVGRACRKGYAAGKMPNGEPMRWAFAQHERGNEEGSI